MKKRALFIFTNNQYQVVFEMMKRVGIYLEEQMGYEIKCCGVGEDYQTARKEEWDFIFSAQGVEFEFLPEADGKMHITWVCDHPRSVLSRFKEYQDKENMLIGCVDRTHTAYLKKYYGIMHSEFAPHFGWEANNIIPYEERSIDVFFPATHTCWEEDVEVRYKGLEGPLKVITEKTIAYLLEHDEVCLEDGFDAVLRSLGETDTLDLTRECMEFVGEYVDLYWRCFYHESIVRTLLMEGITLTVCGKNWNKFKETITEKQNLIVLSEQLPYEEVVEKIGDSRMVLNIVPGFKCGGHERIAMAAINGAVCLTDGNPFIKELFENPEGAVIYDRKKPEALADRIKWLLEHPAVAEQIAQNGQKIAEQKLSVKNFAEWITGEHCLEGK